MGMVSLSLPTITPVGEPFVNEKEPLHKWAYDQDDQGDDVWWHQSRELKIWVKT